MDELINQDCITVWQSKNAPEWLQRSTGASEWIVLIPVQLALPETEALFLRWHSDAHPVIRLVLSNGTVILGGNYPSATTMLGDPQQCAVANTTATQIPVRDAPEAKRPKF
jgi:hypothetical protein